MVLSAVLLSAFASAVLLIAPLIVGALITLYGFSPQQAGMTVSIELGAMSLAGLPAYLDDKLEQRLIPWCGFSPAPRFLRCPLQILSRQSEYDEAATWPACEWSPPARRSCPPP
jgi:hypothetical protein